MSDTAWTKERHYELDCLATLLRTVASLNKSTDFIGNVRLCIDIADQLTRNDHVTPRASFTRFLHELSTKPVNSAEG